MNFNLSEWILSVWILWLEEFSLKREDGMGSHPPWFETQKCVDSLYQCVTNWWLTSLGIMGSGQCMANQSGHDSHGKLHWQLVIRAWLLFLCKKLLLRASRMGCWGLQACLHCLSPVSGWLMLDMVNVDMLADPSSPWLVDMLVLKKCFCQEQTDWSD